MYYFLLETIRKTPARNGVWYSNNHDGLGNPQTEFLKQSKLVLISKRVSYCHGTVSETERVWVINYGNKQP